MEQCCSTVQMVGQADLRCPTRWHHPSCTKRYLQATNRVNNCCPYNADHTAADKGAVVADQPLNAETTDKPEDKDDATADATAGPVPPVVAECQTDVDSSGSGSPSLSPRSSSVFSTEQQEQPQAEQTGQELQLQETQQQEEKPEKMDEEPVVKAEASLPPDQTKQPAQGQQLQASGLQSMLSMPEPATMLMPAASDQGLSPGQEQRPLRRALTRADTARLARPAAINNEALLRLLAEAYGRMMASNAGGSSPAAAMSDEEIEQWLKQLLALSVQAGSNTVVALHHSLRDDHSWLRLSDVYSALLYLRHKYGGVQEEQEEEQEEQA
jgi:hypothetical protein